jgi:hypothetical protein
MPAMATPAIAPPLRALSWKYCVIGEPSGLVEEFDEVPLDGGKIVLILCGTFGVQLH